MDARQAARTLLFASTMELWASLLRLSRPLFDTGQALRSWQGGDRVVVVAPHADDETLGAGAAIAIHRQHGDPVTVAVITDGSGSRAGGLAPDEMARRREEELRGAAQALGVSQTVWLGLPEGRWEAKIAGKRLAPLLDDAEVIYGPSCIDFHPEHLRVARLLAELVQPGQTVRVYELSVPLTPLLANLALDASAVAAQKRRALACYVTQQAAIAPLSRLIRYRRALYGMSQAEVFWEMPAHAYRQLMRHGVWHWQDSPFRGLRPRPFTDLLAFLAGNQTRRGLRQRVQLSVSAPESGPDLI